MKRIETNCKIDVEEINKVYTKDIIEYDLRMHKALEILKENN